MAKHQWENITLEYDWSEFGEDALENAFRGLVGDDHYVGHELGRVAVGEAYAVFYVAGSDKNKDDMAFKFDFYYPEKGGISTYLGEECAFVPGEELGLTWFRDPISKERDNYERFQTNIEMALTKFIRCGGFGIRAIRDNSPLAKHTENKPFYNWKKEA